MKINDVNPKPCEESILPAIIFEVNLAYEIFGEAIINIEGFLESDNGKILAKVEVMPKDEKTSSEVGARGSCFDSDFKKGTRIKTLIVFLSKKALSYIENRRMANSKRDVRLTLNLNVKSISSRARISHFHEIIPQSTGISARVKVSSGSGKRIEGQLLAFGKDSDFYTQYENL